MKIESQTESEVRQMIPGTWRVFEKYDQIAIENGAELEVRDSDHWCAPLRYSINCEDRDKSLKIYKQLDDEVKTTCCQCGCTSEVEYRSCYHDTDWAEKNYLCPNCYARLISRGNGGYRTLLDLREKSKTLNEGFFKEKYKILMPNGDLHYVRLSDLCLKEGKFLLQGKKLLDAVEVTVLGKYTGLRDVTHERVYHGDVVLCSCDFRNIPNSNIENKYYEYWWNTVDWGPSMFSRNTHHSEWCICNAIDGFWALPWDFLINPIVVGSWGKGFIPRKIEDTVFENLDENIKSSIVRNIRRFESERDVKILSR